VSAIRFRPWVGEYYASASQFGKKILILGDSHYQWNKAEPIDDQGDLTVDCIKEQISGDGSHAFWTRIVSAFLNHRPTLAEKALFWNSVAFYNYIQFSVGFGARVRPTDQMWTDSEPGFVQVLNSQKPDMILVLGYENWDHLPELGGASGPEISGAEHKRSGTWRYPYAGGAALAYAVPHPSSGGFSGSYWHPYVMRAIELA